MFVSSMDDLKRKLHTAEKILWSSSNNIKIYYVATKFVKRAHLSIRTPIQHFLFIFQFICPE